MGLNINVYRTKFFGQVSDCTMNGISSKADSLCLVNLSGPFEPTDDRPAAMLVKGNRLHTVKIVPVGKDGKPMTYIMDGGNYGASSDSRFTEAVEKITGVPFYGAVAIHDRVEP